MSVSTNQAANQPGGIPASSGPPFVYPAAGQVATTDGNGNLPLQPAGAARQVVSRLTLGTPFGQHVNHARGTSDGLNTGINCRISQIAPCRGGSIQVAMGGWFSAESSLTNDYTVTAAIEYPAGTFIPVFWSGESPTASRSVLVKAGASRVLSDPVGLDVIPAGAQYWIKLFITVAPVETLLTTTLMSTGAAITTLPVGNATVAIPNNTVVSLSNSTGTQSQLWTVTPAVAAGNPVTVASQVPNFAYPVGSTMTYNNAGKWVNGITPNATNGEGFTIGTVQTDHTLATLSGAITSITVNGTLFTTMPGVEAVLAQAAPVGQKSVAMVGDSRMDGFRGGGPVTDENWLTTGMGTGIGVTWLSRTGGDGSQFTGLNGTRRWPVAQLCNTMVNGYGINDLNGGATLAALQATQINIGTAADLRGMTSIQTTLPPWSPSTDFFATIANQTPFAAEMNRKDINWWMRSGAPIDPATMAVISGTGNIVAGSNQVTGVAGNFVNGQTISAYGIPVGTIVAAGGGTATLTLSNPATQTRAANLSAGSLLATPESAHPYSGYFELAWLVESTPDSGVWMITGFSGIGDVINTLPSVTNASLGFQNGQAYNSANTPAGTYILSGGGTPNLLLSQNATATAAAAPAVAGFTSDGIHPAPITDPILAQGVALALIN